MQSQPRCAAARLLGYGHPGAQRGQVHVFGSDRHPIWLPIRSLSRRARRSTAGSRPSGPTGLTPGRGQIIVVFVDTDEGP